MTLRPIESKLIEDLFVRDGYVLEFTNQTFFEFLKNEVGIDIYDDEGLKPDPLLASSTPRTLFRGSSG
ncbi:hypothetical protein CCGE525_24970 (plasmid) [Rhizobium jaguaris]|uniref:Uncharacterized protein n=1 Tax=Rhizobium jaguaris TaxID=1312183 RepID=A0A387FWJ1_9HYPH|nr:hypothetical protein CCGE525_24970 [Rhizobium jaguaris]